MVYFMPGMEGLSELTSDAICARAIELGADLAGVVKSQKLEREDELLSKWLKMGYHGDMTWLAQNRELRSDPGKVLDGCKSIIMIAVNYFTPYYHVGIPNFPKVSRYSWGGDYHVVLRNILQELEIEIKNLALSVRCEKVRTKIAVDSLPFREKVWAVRAGIGWQGKNTLVINKEYGSWLFLGGLLTTLDLDPGPVNEVPDNCGSCTLCIEACPTGALKDQGILDARVCISYLTIEHDGIIPAPLRDQLSGWIYGCDVCQNVCPWNQYAKPAKLPYFMPKPELLVPDLQVWSQMSSEEYEKLTHGTSMVRCPSEYLRRNALAVMGLL